MSLVKNCLETLENGTVEQKYIAARFLILSSVENQKTHLEYGPDSYKKLIFEFCYKYNLRKRKLGKFLATGMLENH